MKQLELKMPMKKWRWAYQMNDSWGLGHVPHKSILVTDEWYGEKEAQHVFQYEKAGWELIGRVWETEALK